MRPPTWIIANPAAADGRARARIRNLQPGLRGWPAPPRILWTERPGHGRDLARRARREGAGLVVAAGGDGTVHEVVNGLLEDGVPGAPPLGVLAVGTSGDFARSLGLGKDPEAEIQELWRAPERAVDVGSCALAGMEGEDWFVNAANAGLGAQVARRVAGSRALRRLGPGAYAAATLGALLSRTPVVVEVRVDGGVAWRGPSLNVSVCNGPYFGGGMRPAPAASLSSGMLHTVIVHPMGAPRAAWTLGRVLLRRPPRRGRVTVLEGASGVAVDPADEDVGATAVEVDGEIPGRLPGRFQAHPRALRVRVPPTLGAPD